MKIIHRLMRALSQFWADERADFAYLFSRKPEEPKPAIRRRGRNIGQMGIYRGQ